MSVVARVGCRPRGDGGSVLVLIDRLTSSWVNDSLINNTEINRYTEANARWVDALPAGDVTPADTALTKTDNVNVTVTLLDINGAKIETQLKHNSLLI